MKILICSIGSDSHVAATTHELNKKRSDFIYLKTDQLSAKSGLLFNSAFEKPYYLIDNNKRIQLSDIKSLWIRKPFLDLFKPNYSNKRKNAAFEFKWKEMQYAFSGLFHAAKRYNIFTINEYTAGAIAKNKIEQLDIAKNLGFNIPGTIVSCNPKEIYTFIFTHGNKCVIKTLNQENLSQGEKYANRFTTAISLEKFANYTSENKLDYPILIQEKIEKAYELRITIVGKKVFSCSIDTQSNPNSIVDSRLVNPYELKHEMVRLPKFVQKSCLEIMRHYNLQFAAIDMAVTPEGKYIFFEINPAGQYLWIEEMTKAPISKAIANLLIDPEKNRLN